MNKSFTYNFPEIKEFSFNSQMWKITEECNEVADEHAKAVCAMIKGADYNVGDLVFEIMDLIHACETMLRTLNLSEQELSKYRYLVEMKNRERGYYKE